MTFYRYKLFWWTSMSPAPWQHKLPDLAKKIVLNLCCRGNQENLCCRRNRLSCYVARGNLCSWRTLILQNLHRQIVVKKKKVKLGVVDLKFNICKAAKIVVSWGSTAQRASTTSFDRTRSVQWVILAWRYLRDASPTSLQLRFLRLPIAAQTLPRL